MELADGSLSKEDTDTLASALTDIAIAAGECCTTWGDVAAVLNDVELTQGKDGTLQMYFQATAKGVPAVLDAVKGAGIEKVALRTKGREPPAQAAP